MSTRDIEISMNVAKMFLDNLKVFACQSLWDRPHDPNNYDGNVDIDTILFNHDNGTVNFVYSWDEYIPCCGDHEYDSHHFIDIDVDNLQSEAQRIQEDFKRAKEAERLAREEKRKRDEEIKKAKEEREEKALFEKLSKKYGGVSV